MKVFITGGPDFVGRYLSKDLAGLGHEVTVLTRFLFALGRFHPPSQYSPHHRDVLAPGEQQGAIAICPHL
jgi:nucleoside-diphosphate-sugar epimerase